MFLAILAFVSLVAPVTGATFEDCTALLTANRLSRAAAACFYDTGAAEGRWNVAADRLGTAALANPDAGWLRYYLGELTARLNTAAALPHYRAAAALFERHSESSAEAEARRRLALALLQAGDGEAATIESEKAVTAARRGDDRQLLAQALMDRAIIFLRRSERLSVALHALQEAQSLLLPDDPYAMRTLVLQRLAGVLFALGRYEHAHSHYETLITMARERSDVAAEAMAHFNRLTVRRRQMEILPDRSLLGAFIEDARTGLALAEASGQPSRQVSAHRVLGDLLLSIGARDDAERHYRAALSASHQANDPVALSDSLWSLGRALASARPVDSARLIDEALEVAVHAQQPAAVAYAWRQRMRLAWKMLPREEAVRESRRALQAIETIRDLQGADDARAGVFSTWTLDYYWLLGTVLGAPAPTRSDVTLAFDIAERMRARLLLETLLRNPAAAATGSAHAETRRQLLRSLSDVQRRLLDPRLGEPIRVELLTSLERLEREEAAVRAELLAGRAGNSPAGAVALASLDEIERALRPDEAVLSFNIGIDENFYGEFGGGASLFVVSNTGTHVVRVADRVKLQRGVSMFRGLTEHAEQIESRASVRLYDWLLREALSQLPGQVKRLVIVPDGPLHHLPFAALRAAPDAPLLAETHEIVVAPSAAVWLQLRRTQPAHASRAALVLADPQLLDSIRRDEADDERGWWPEARRLGSLPHARAEGRSVFSRIGGASQLLMGAEASEAAFKAADPNSYRLVHLAAHALVDEEYPDRSTIFVAPGDGGDDGLLQAREIADLSLNGHIVVLSACRSATGAVLSGEGVMGLSRAFIAAGATTVVGTLWAIQDDHAAQFFDWFYDSFSRGRTVGAALAEARRRAIASGMPAFAWSSIVAIGNDTAVIGVTTGRSLVEPWFFVALAAGALLVGASAWIVRRRWPATAA